MIPKGTPSQRAQNNNDVNQQLHSPNQGLDFNRYWQVDLAEYGEISEMPVSKFAKISADNLQASSSIIPSVTHTDKADIEELEQFRKSIKEELSTENVKLTITAFFIKALAKTLIVFPKFNTSLTHDGQSLIQKHYIHIGVAVDTDYGLIVPVIRNLDRLGVLAIASSLSELVEKAKNKKLQPSEMGGASITISNLGSIGGINFSPIINPPEVAILGITPATVEPSWNGSEFLPRLKTPLQLTYDHRVINGAEAARFMKYFCNLLQSPNKLIL